MMVGEVFVYICKRGCVEDYIMRFFPVDFNDHVIMEMQCIVTKNRMSKTTHCFVEIYPDWFSDNWSHALYERNLINKVHRI